MRNCSGGLCPPELLVLASRAVIYRPYSLESSRRDPPSQAKNKRRINAQQQACRSSDGQRRDDPGNLVNFIVTRRLRFEFEVGLVQNLTQVGRTKKRANQEYSQ